MIFRYVFLILLVLAILTAIQSKSLTSVLVVLGIALIELFVGFIFSAQTDKIVLNKDTISIYNIKFLRSTTLVFNLTDTKVRFIEKTGARGIKVKVLRVYGKDNSVDIRPGLSGWSTKTLSDFLVKVNMLKQEV